VSEAEFKAVVSALLRTSPMPMADIPRKRVKRESPAAKTKKR